MRLAELAAKLALFAVFVLLSGCETFLPSAGPSADAVNAGVSTSGLPYALVQLTPQVVDVVGDRGAGAIAATFADRRPPPDILFGVGDVVTITIFEAAAGGLFIPPKPASGLAISSPCRTSRSTLPATFRCPMPARSRRPADTAPRCSAKSSTRSKNRAIEPQAVVALATQNTSLISVLGEVNTPNRFPASPGRRAPPRRDHPGRRHQGPGLRHLGRCWSATASAPQRRSRSWSMIPRNNIWVRPNDTIYVFREPQTFLAFGAARPAGPVHLRRLAYQPGRSGRQGRRSARRAGRSRVGLPVSPRTARGRRAGSASTWPQQGPTVPVIYDVSFRDAGGYFLATKIEMRDKDVIFAANAPRCSSASSSTCSTRRRRPPISERRPR